MSMKALRARTGTLRYTGVVVDEPTMDEGCATEVLLRVDARWLYGRRANFLACTLLVDGGPDSDLDNLHIGDKMTVKGYPDAGGWESVGTNPDGTTTESLTATNWKKV